ncbi:MAG: hypothetical protein AAFR04_09570 [Pseudomonadota bacterium]
MAASQTNDEGARERSRANREAFGVMLKALQRGSDRGLEPEVMAYAALYTGLRGLVDSYSEDVVADLLADVALRVRSGHFTTVQRHH